MAPEVEKFRIPEIGRILNGIGNVWLTLVAAGLLVDAAILVFGAQTLAAGLENLRRQYTLPTFYVLLFLALSPGVGMKVWAKWTVRRPG